MGDRLERLESELRSTRETLERLQDRVLVLEQRLPEPTAEGARPAAFEGGSEPALAEPPIAVRPDEAAAVEEPSVRVGAGLIGGILLVIAGGYLLRALTETGVLSTAVGVAVGLVYAFSWSVVGHLLAARGQRGAASANGIATALVAIPLIWEATTRFEVLPPWIAAGLLLVVGAVLLPLAERRQLPAVAWFAVLGLGVASVVLMFGTREPEPFAVTLLLLGLTAAILGGRHGGLLPWTAYAFADLGALLLVLASLGEVKLTSPVPTVAILVAFFLGFLAVFVYHSWRRGEIGLDEPLQGTVATLLGFGGALLIADAQLPAVAPALAGGGLLLGAGGYVFLLTSLEWTRQHRWPFLLYSSLALGVLALSIVVLFPQPAWVFAALAVVLAAVGVWLDRVSPGLHAAISVLLAAATSGLWGTIRLDLTRPPESWPAPSPVALAALAAALLCALLPLRVHSPVWPEWLPRLGRAAVILVAALGLDALLVYGLHPVLTAGMEPAMAESVLDTLRTGALALLVVVLALLSHLRPLQPAAWLVYPLLALAGLKLVAVDFPGGKALTLAIALLLYGGALILAPRWTRLRPAATSAGA